MTYLRKASVGSISSGTLRTVDLLGNFACELEHISADHAEIVTEAREREDVLLSGEDETYLDSELVSALVDALTELAPPYCYFGASEGDGADFGFWPIMDQIDELPSIQNVEGEDIPAEDHKYVNDHGNVTVYGADGSILLELV